MKLNNSKVALTVGVFVSGMHVLWSVLVAIGLAQPLLDFIFSIHMIANPYQVMIFSLTSAITLVIVTFVVGYVVGWVFAEVWNRLHK